MRGLAFAAGLLLAGCASTQTAPKPLGADVIEVPADAMGAAVVEAYLGIKRQGSL